MFQRKDNIDANDLANEIERHYRRSLSLAKKRKYRLQLITATFVAAAITLFLILMPSNISLKLNDIFVADSILALVSSPAVVAGVLVAATTVFGKFLFSYLQPEVETSLKESASNSFAAERALSFYEKKLHSLDKKYDALIQGVQSGSLAGEIFTQEEKSELLSSIERRMQDDAMNEYIEKLSEKISIGLQYKQYEDVFNRILLRLEVEVKSQSKRGNVNLLLGIMTTVIGVGLLGYAVFSAPVIESWIGMMAHFLPRISLVVVVEVFAYFFLRLYKQSLEEIKYFQNEITNIESKYLGLYVALQTASGEGVLSIVDNLAKTERNFILEKGQSTTYLELKKLEQSTNEVAAEKVNSILSSVIKLK